MNRHACAIYRCAKDPVMVLWTKDGRFGDWFCESHAAAYEAKGYLREKP